MIGFVSFGGERREKRKKGPPRRHQRGERERKKAPPKREKRFSSCSHFSVHVQLRNLPGAVGRGPHLFSGLLIGGDEVDLGLE